MRNNKRKRSVFEVALVVVVVSLALIMGVALYAGRAKVQKGRLLIQELVAMRQSVLLFKLVNYRFPYGLDELANSTYEMESVKHSYIDNLYASKEGEFIDPFGNPFTYDPKTGWIASTTPGYTRW